MHTTNTEFLQVNGLINPAKVVMYGAKGCTIAGLNYTYKQIFPDKYDKLHLNPELSTTLRACIAASAAYARPHLCVGGPF